MRNSRILRVTREGHLASCVKINITHPNVVDLAGLAGADAVWLCNEHVPNDWHEIEHCIRAAKTHDMDAIVRVSKGSYSDYVRPLEAGAAGIMVPHVTSADEARRIVEMCRFHPLGKRALDGGNTDANYCQMPLDEYVATSNRETLLILQIESPEAVEVIEEIAAVPGYDFLMFGPGDYSHRIGHAGNIQHPDLVAGRRRMEEAARKHGKQLFAVAAGGTPQEQFERGYTISYSASDVYCLGEALRQSITKSRLETSNAAPYGKS